jgi:hypothetical protein
MNSQRFSFGLRNCRKQKRGENSDDGDDDQKLDQSKTCSVGLSHISWLGLATSPPGFNLFTASGTNLQYGLPNARLMRAVVVKQDALVGRRSAGRGLPALSDYPNGIKSFSPGLTAQRATLGHDARIKSNPEMVGSKHRAGGQRTVQLFQG